MLALLALLACVPKSSSDPAPEPAEAALSSPEAVAPEQLRVLLSEDARLLADARLTLGLRLLAATPAGDAVLSPHALSEGLTMAWVGAAGASADALAALLFGEAAGPGWSAERRLNAGEWLATQAAEPVIEHQLEGASALWMRPGLAPSAEVSQALSRYFDDPLAVVDFASPEGLESAAQLLASGSGLGPPEGAVTLLSEASLGADTQVFLFDALHLQAHLKAPFEALEAQPFTGASGASTQVPALRHVGLVRTARLSGVLVVELPLADGRRSLLLLMPQTPGPVDALLGALDADAVASLRGGLRPRTTELSLPALSLRTQRSLAAPLTSLGAASLFSGDADLTPLTGAPGVPVSESLHDAALSLSATAPAEPFSAEGAEPLRFDRPFLFLVMDKDAGALLVGRISEL